VRPFNSRAPPSVACPLHDDYDDDDDDDGAGLIKKKKYNDGDNKKTNYTVHRYTANGINI